MIYNESLRDYRYKYEKEKLKRVPLDLPIEKEYIPLKEYCESKGTSISGFIRDLIKSEIAGRTFTIPEKEYDQLDKILSAEGKTLQEWIETGIKRFIESKQ